MSARENCKLFVALFLSKIRPNYLKHPQIILLRTIRSVLTYVVQTCNSVEFEMVCWTREEDASGVYHGIRFRPLTPGCLSSLLSALREGQEARLFKLGR